jgi:ABC-type branched-subunit amino acid transport system ATPase component
MITLIRHLADQWGLAVLLVEHDVNLVREVSDRIVALSLGAVIAQGAPDDVLADAKVVEVYLGAEMDDDATAAEGVSA